MKRLATGLRDERSHLIERLKVNDECVAPLGIVLRVAIAHIIIEAFVVGELDTQ